MRIRQFEATSVREAMSKVKEIMGPQALILTTSEEKTGGKPRVVVTAAVDQDDSSYPPGVDADHRMEETRDGTGWSDRLEIPEVWDEDDAQLKSTLVLLREMIDHAVHGRARGPKSLTDQWITLLLDRGVERSTAYTIVYRLFSRLKRLSRQEKVPGDLLEEAVARIFKVTGEIELKEKSPRFVVFLGPPGVGKTTTLAKLAARLKKKTTRPIILLGTDVYRIGGMDQLFIYGNLMGVPVETVRSKRDFRQALASYPSNALFLVDTTGRSHMDDQGLMEIKLLIDHMAKEMWAYLLLDAGKKRENLLKEIKGYALFSFHSLIWTKVDEAEMPGEIINVMLRTKFPVSYVTTGQNVPGDIELARPRRLSEIILTNKESRRFLWTKRQN